MILSRFVRLAALAAVLPPLPPLPPIGPGQPSPPPSGPTPPAAVQSVRTFRVAPPGVDPNGPSGEPSIGGDGRYIAFASEASNLGPHVGTSRTSQIYVFDFHTLRATLISSSPTGAPGNHPSADPAISADGQVVAFASDATNLVAGTPKRVSEIFVRVGSRPVFRISVGFGGVQPDADSTQPVISADGRYVAFTSAADNLVPGDDNASPDIFVVDLARGTIKRVSVSSRGVQALGESLNPSISGNGRYVSFTSSAPNLVPRDRNRVPDVFVHDMVSASTVRVSVSSRGRPQNRSVPQPFSQVSSLDGPGHYIVFDSNASNLAPGAGRGHTDVFRHSLVSGHTWLVSQNSVGQEANNDSFSPALSADARVTTFEAFADNLATPWTPSENVFAQDFTNETALTPDVTPQGTARGPELDPQLLQRPAISADGRLMAFTSGADDLVSGDYNGTDDVFVRVLTPPQTGVVKAPPATTSDPRPQVEFSGTGPLSTFGVCQLDGRRHMCPLGRPFRLWKVRPGRHALTVMAGGPGTLFDPVGVTVRFTET